MNKLYEEIVFHNDTAPELNEDNLNAMSEALNAIDDRVIEGYASAILVGRVLDDAKGYADAAETSANNAAEKVVEAAQQVTLAEEQVTLAAGQVGLAADQVDLAKDQVEIAKGYAEEAAKGSGGNDLAYANNILQLKRDDTVLSEVEIRSSVDVEVATTEKAGIVKPDGETITVDADGTIHGATSVDGIVIREITEAEYLANQAEYDAMDIEWNITDAETINLPTIDITKADYLANQEYFDNLPNIINIIDEMPLDAYDVPYKNTTVGGQLDTMVEYSTEERVVGKWIDGKPLYERLITNGSASANTTVRVPLNVEIDMAFIVFAVLADSQCCYDINSPSITNVTSKISSGWFTNNNHSTNKNTFSYSCTIATTKMMALIRYTKTTDEVEEG